MRIFSRPVKRFTGSTLLLIIIIILGSAPSSAHAAFTGVNATNAAPFGGVFSGNFGGSTSFYAQNLRWLFFVWNYTSGGNAAGCGAAGCIEFSTSADGMTWTAGTNTTFPSITGDLLVTHNSTTVLVAGFARNDYLTVGSVTSNFILRSAPLTLAGSLSWTSYGIPYNMTSGAADLKISTSNLVFVSTIGYSTTAGGSVTKLAAIHSTSSAWTAWTINTVDAVGSIVTMPLLALSGGDMFMAYTETTGGSIGLVNGTRWDSASTTWKAGESVYQQTSGSRSVGGLFGDAVHLYVYVRDGGTSNLEFCARSTGPTVTWGCKAISGTTALSTYSVTFAPDLRIFVVFLFQTGSWNWFTLNLVNNNPSASVSLGQTSFTAANNGVTPDDGYTAINPNSAFIDLYWTSGSANPWPINYATLVLSGGQGCIGAVCAGPSPGGGPSFFPGFATATICPLGNNTFSIGCYTVPVQLIDPRVPYFVVGLVGLTLSSYYLAPGGRLWQSRDVHHSSLRKKKRLRKFWKKSDRRQSLVG